MGLLNISRLEGTSIIVQNEVLYKNKDIQIYIDKLEIFKHRDIIKGNFNDSTWLIKTGINTFKFDFYMDREKYNDKRFKLSYEDFTMAFKSFILFKLDNLGGHSIANFIPFFKKIMIQTNFLEYEKALEYISDKTTQIDTNLKYVIEFLTYTSLYNTVEQDIIEDMNVKMEDAFCMLIDKKRTLPQFESVFKFDRIIEQFLTVATEAEKEKYFPVVLWWKLTTIIPLRATEFTLIPSDCILEENGSYMLKINRSTNKNNKDKSNVRQHKFEYCYRECTIKISKDIYELILEYKNLVDKYDEEADFFEDGSGEYKRKFLISSRSQYKMSKIKYDISKKRYDKEYFGYKQMEYLKNKFFFDIVENKFNIKMVESEEEMVFDNEINKINLMDTRHFAIINMVFMGYEPVNIKEMAGHESVYSSYSYFAHIDEFMKCYIISKSKVFGDTNHKDYKVINNIEFKNTLATGNERYKIASLNHGLKRNLKKVDGGFCEYEKDDFKPCRSIDGKHSKCKYFIKDINYRGDYNDGMQELQSDLDSEIETIKYLVKNHTKIKEFNKIVSTRINRMHDMADVIAKRIADNRIN